MALIFTKVRYKNFLSSGNQFTEIELNKSSTTLIVGDNGSGKSTMLDALTFGLFGKPFRKINIPQLVNSINEKKCLVEVEFLIGKTHYMVRRGLKPKVFEIYKDGEMYNQTASTRDYQTILETSILKLNFKSFTQIVILGNSSFVPFMQLPAAHRREIIEDLLDLEIFSKMNILLKERLNENKSAIKDYQNALEVVSEKIRLQKEYIDTLRDDKQKQVEKNESEIKKHEDQITVYEDKISKLNKSINTLVSKLTAKDEIKIQQDNVSSMQSKLKIKHSKLLKEKAFFENNDVCPTCKQNIDDEFKKDTIDTRSIQLNELDTAVEKLDNRLSTIAEKLKHFQDISNKIDELTRERSIEESNITSIRNYIRKVQSDIKSITQTTDDIDKQLQVLSDKHEEKKTLEKNIEHIRNNKVVLEMASILLKDTGIKTKIIKQYIPIMNKLINKYLSAMDFFVNFELDETFNEIIRSRHRDEFSYSSFSEGEKAKINLAIILTWRSIGQMKNSMNTNLLIMDEVFDGSIDADGIEKLVEIFETLNNVNLFIISHKEQMLDKFSKTIRFEKIKNFSRII